MFKKLLSIFAILSFITPLFAGVTTYGTNKPLTDDQKILHLLNRITYGPRPGDVEKVKNLGIDKFLEQQLNPASIADTDLEARVKRLDVFEKSTAELFREYPNPGSLIKSLEKKSGKTPSAEPAKAEDEMTDKERQERRQQIAELYKEYGFKPANQINQQFVANRVIRAAYSEKALQEVMVDFWQNHFNVFSGKNAVRWFIPSYERDVLRKHALGNFKDLLTGTAEHPAMLFFLDNFQNVSPNMDQKQRPKAAKAMMNNGNLNPKMRERLRERGLTDAEINARVERAQKVQQKAPQMKRGLNENYARELMELHTLGVDGGYSQQDIIEVAKCFTGWTIADPRGYRKTAKSLKDGDEEKRLARIEKLAGIPDDLESGEFYFNPRAHEDGTKRVLGQEIKEDGVNEGKKVIEILVSHPSTAKFIAKKLAVKFVNDDPKPELVNRVAAAFTKSKGDIKTTLRALFTDKEFYAPENYKAKIKTPFELAVSSVRALSAEITPNQAFGGFLTKLGEVPYQYQAPTGYPDTAEDWVNTGALLERLNFAIVLASNRIPGTRVDLKQFESKNKSDVLNKAITAVLHDEVSPDTRSLLAKQLEQPLPEAKAAEVEEDEAPMGGMRQGGRRNPTARLLPATGDPTVFQAVSLVLGSPEFQRQ